MINIIRSSAPIQQALVLKNKTPHLINKILYGQNWAKQPPRFELTKQRIHTLLYGQNGVAQEPVTISEQESAFQKALRFSDDFDWSSRLYKLLPNLTEEQRFTFAKLEAAKTNGITDCCNFVRYKLPKYDLSEENRRTLLQELDCRSSGHASKVAK